MIDAQTDFTIGYGGYGCISWKQDSLVNLDLRDWYADDAVTDNNSIYITSANISSQVTRPMQTTYQSTRTTEQISPIILGVGTVAMSGSVSFDMTKNNVTQFLDQKKIARNTYFNLYMSDGDKKYNAYHCVWNNITFSASSGSLVTCSISFLSLNNRKSQLDKNGILGFDEKTYFDNTLVSYWQTGFKGSNNHIQSFNLNFTQQVSAVYLNNTQTMPSYLRCGSIGINATIQSWYDWQDVDSIQIGDKRVKFNNKAINMRQFSHSGAGDVGKHSYQIVSVAVTKPTDEIFTIFTIE